MGLLRRGRLRREARVLNYDAAAALRVAALWFLPVAAAATVAATSPAAAPTLRVAPTAADQRGRVGLVVVLVVVMVVRMVDIGGGGGAGDYDDAGRCPAADLVREVILGGQFPPRADSGLPLASAAGREGRGYC